VCKVSKVEATAGTFPVEVHTYNKGYAEHSITHTILMEIESISPRNGSVFGGTTLTITGSGFAPFGLHNKIVLSFANNTGIIIF